MLTQNSFIKLLKSKILRQRFSSKNYWERRYAEGGNSGGGSYGHLAKYKADVLNQFVTEKLINSVIEFGCGDGNQLKLSTYPSYTGYDVSSNAISRCQDIFRGDHAKRFFILDQYAGEKADLSISLDVIFHLVEDNVFHEYMDRLFSASLRHVVIYSSNKNEISQNTSEHVRHRKFTDWIEKNRSSWKLDRVVPNKYPYDGNSMQTTFADFYFYSSV